MTSQTNRRASLAAWSAAAFLIVVAHLAVFGFLLRCSFSLDDWDWLWVGKLGAERPSALWSLQVSGFFRPLVTLYWVLVAKTTFLDARPQYAAAIAVAAMFVLIAAVVMTRLTRSRLLGALLALVFATHPAHAQVTCWLAARTSALLALWSVACVAAWSLYLQKGRRFYGMATVGCFFLALLTKEEAVALLPLLGLQGWVQPDGQALRDRLRRAARPFLVMLIGWSGYLAFQRTNQARSPLVSSSEFQIGPQMLVRELQRLPNLVAPQSAGALKWATIALFASVIAMALWRGDVRTRRLILLGLAAAVFCLLPTSGFRTLWFAHRYYYLGVGGICVALAAACGLLCRMPAPSRLLGLFSRLLCIGLIAGMLASNIPETQAEIAFWRDQGTLGQDLLTAAQSSRVFAQMQQRLQAKQPVTVVRLPMPMPPMISYLSLVGGYSSLNPALLREAETGEFVVYFDRTQKAWLQP